MPTIATLFETIPWEALKASIRGGYRKERKSKDGRKRIHPLILYKMHVLQKLFNLSNEELELPVNDRRLFENFVGLVPLQTMLLQGFCLD